MMILSGCGIPVNNSNFKDRKFLDQNYKSYQNISKNFPNFMEKFLDVYNIKEII